MGVKTSRETEETSIPNSDYIKAKSLLRSKKGEEKRKAYQKLRKLKSTQRVGFKLNYIRYADH